MVTPVTPHYCTQNAVCVPHREVTGSPCFTCSSVGFGVRASSALAAIIMPFVQ